MRKLLSVLTCSILFISLILSLSSCSDTRSPTEVDNTEIVANITGSVTSNDTFEGISDVLLKLVQSGNTIDSVYTSESGKYSFERVSEGDYQVDVYLPEGFEIVNAPSKDITILANDLEVNFSAVPIKEKSSIVEQGAVQTLALSSGASLTVDASSATSDIEIQIEQVPIDQQSIFGLTNEEYRVIVGSDQEGNVAVSGTNKKLSALPIPITISAKPPKDINESLLGMKFEIGNRLEKIYSYAFGLVDEHQDQNTGKYYKVIKHEFEYEGEPIAFSFTLDEFSGSCSVSDRRLEKNSAMFTGDTPLILVHGIKLEWGNCEDFEDFNPSIDYFNSLIEAMTLDDDITSKYQLYTYKYPSNSSISSNGEVLKDLIESNDIKDAVIIGHSMGGLVARSMMQSGGASRVSKLITLGTPHEGTPAADIAYDKNILNKIRTQLDCTLLTLQCAAVSLKTSVYPPTPGLNDLREGEEFIKNMIDVGGDPDKVFSIGGNLASISDFSISFESAGYMIAASHMFFSFEFKSDGVVPLKSAIPEWSGLRKELGGIDHSEIKDGNKSVVYNEIRKLLIGSESNIVFEDFGITKDRYEDTSDWDQIVQDNFGVDYRVADWNDLKKYHADGGNLLELFDELGLKEYNISAFVTRSGDRNYSTSRYYFASRHEGNRPSNYLAHENINNYEISLGSWWGSRQIIVFKDNSD